MQKKGIAMKKTYVSKLGNYYLHVFLLFSIYLISASVNAQSQWQAAGSLNVPEYNYCFLAVSRTGDLMAATFYSNDATAPPSKIPAFLIKNATSQSPQLIELCNIEFPTQRGYSGLACDDTGSFYLSGDTGVASTCFVKKFKSDGSPDISFGTNGEIRPNKRCLGLDVVGEYLFLAVDWGKILIYNSKTGQVLDSLPPAKPSVFLRDIAIDPSSLRIYGVAAGSVVIWEGGSPTSASNYTFKVLTQKSGEVRSSEGISFDPISRSGIISPIPGNVLLAVKNDGTVNKSAVISDDPAAHYCDSAISFDGSTIFISDIITKKIHVMKRTFNETTAEIKPDLKPPIQMSSSASLKDIVWNKSYTQVMDKARSENSPMVVYFRKSGFAKCEEFEKNVLLSENFKSHAQRFICVFEDIGANPILGSRFGVFRTPYIAIIDSKGDIIARYIYNINPETLYSSMDAAK